MRSYQHNKYIALILSFVLAVSLTSGMTANAQISPEYSEALTETEIQERFTAEWRRESFAGSTLEYSLTSEDTEAWAELPDLAAKLEALTLPEDTLAQSSPEELVAAALDYPMFGNMFLFDTYQKGFEVISSQSNVLCELLERAPETAPIIKEIFVNLDLAAFMEQDAHPTLRLYYMTTILTQDRMLDALNSAELNELLNACNQMMEYIQTEESGYSPTAIYRLEGQILSICDSEFNQILAENADLAAFVNGETDFLSSEALQAMSIIPDLVPTVIATPNGSVVPAYMRTELTPEDIQDLNDYCKDAFPNASYQSTATRKYNCHSYAWYKQSTSNSVWLDSPNWQTFVTDGSYSTCATSFGTIPTSVPIGAKVQYASDDHSAVVYSRTKMISKWGQGALMVHAPDDCPYSADTLIFYS